MKTKQKKLEGGLRLKGKTKKKPLITIITVVFNGEKTLERAIKSVINQTARKDIDYIIIDGGSTDGTLNIIKKYNSKLDYWVSEHDKGIYDAMNKGVKLANGKYIQFLNSDDYLYNLDIISKISFKLDNLNPDALYGQIKINDEIWPIVERKVLDLKKGLTLPHPALFVNKNFIINNKFNLDYKIASDFDFECKLFINDSKIIFIPSIITNFTSGGTCNKNFNTSLMESSKIILNYFGFWYFMRYLLSYARTFFLVNLIEVLRK